MQLRVSWGGPQSRIGTARKGEDILPDCTCSSTQPPGILAIEVPIGFLTEKTDFQMIFDDFLGRRGGRASGRLDHGLENPSGEAALAADLITALLLVLRIL